MKDFVSGQWGSVVVLVASTSVVCAILVPYGSPWTGLAWAGLAMSSALAITARSRRSIRQTISDVEAEPMLTAAVAQRRSFDGRRSPADVR